MFVTVALFELHIPHAQSLKDKRMVVRSVRDKLRNLDLSVKEVAFHDLHQRARKGTKRSAHAHHAVVGRERGKFVSS